MGVNIVEGEKEKNKRNEEFLREVRNIIKRANTRIVGAT